MNSDEIYDVLRIVESMPGKNDKVAVLQDFLDDPEFEKVLKLAYHPHTNFGVLSMPLVHGDRGVFTLATFQLLDDLANRSVSGRNAREAIADELVGLSGDSASLFLNILKKDLRAGFSAKTINKAKPKTIPVVPYMRCSLPKDVKDEIFIWEDGVYSQEKMDGMFVNVTNYEDATPISTRTGHHFNNRVLGDFTNELNVDLPIGYQTHGELLIMGTHGFLDRKTSNGMFNHILKSGEGLADSSLIIYLVAWDTVPLNVILGLEESKEPYQQRLEKLQGHLGDCNVACVAETRVSYTKEESVTHYNDVIARGGEGTIVKSAQGLWKNGTSKHQYKLKAERECELFVADFIEGNGKYEGSLGALVCVSSDGLLQVNVSGMTDQLRAEIWAGQEGWLGSIITVRFNEVITSKTNELHSLFLPRFIERRIDKIAADPLPYIQGL
jgi:DNA ligase 1